MPSNGPFMAGEHCYIFTYTYVNVAAAVVAKPVAGSPVSSPDEPSPAPVLTHPVQRAQSGKCK